MSRKARVSASLIAQAKRRQTAQQPDNIVALLTDQIIDTPDPQTGKARFQVVVPGKGGPRVYDLSDWQATEGWAPIVTEGFRLWQRQVAANTAYSGCGNLRRLATAFANQSGPQEADPALWTAVKKWLDDPKADGEPWSESTRSSHLGNLRSVLEALLGHYHFGSVAAHLLHESGFPGNPWPGRNTKIKPADVLRPDQRIALIRACLAEIEEIRQRIEQRDQALDLGIARLAVARAAGEIVPYDDPAVCAALVEEVSPDSLASHADLRRIDPFLATAVKRHGMTTIRGILYNSFRDLVPFVVLIAIATAFNPETVLSLIWSNVARSHDGMRISITGIKNRAANGQSSTQVAQDTFAVEVGAGLDHGVGPVLDLLDRMTSRTRQIITPEEHDRLFIGVPVNGGSTAKALNGHGGPWTDSAWSYSLTSFLERHSLPLLTLRMLRQTEAEMVYRQTGSLLAVRDRLNHRSAATQRRHYTSGYVRREGQDRIGAAQELVLRFAETQGATDPRGLPNPEDALAATRGFGCLDPYGGVQPGQREGQLCAAYGRCPSCPLMVARPQNVPSVAAYLSLRRAIHGSRASVASADAWTQRWAPVLSALEELLAEVPNRVMKQAKELSVSMPKV